MHSLCMPPQYLAIPGEAAIPWPEWKHIFENYMLASGASEFSDARRRAILIHSLGIEANRLLGSKLTLPKSTTTWSGSDAQIPTNTYDSTLKIINDFFAPRQNKFVQRRQFRRRHQKSGETVDNYVAALRQILATCDYAKFGEALLEQLLIEQLIEATNDMRIQERLLMEPDLTLNKATIIARQIESSTMYSTALQSTMKSSISYSSTSGHNNYLANRNLHYGKPRNKSVNCSDELNSYSTSSTCNEKESENCIERSNKQLHEVQLKQLHKGNLYHSTENNFSFDDEGYLIIYTDGACTKNGSDEAVAGAGVYFGPNNALNHSELIDGKCTNNRAELQAVIIGLQKARQMGFAKVKILTDSKLIINGVTLWLHKWQQNNWKNYSGHSIANIDDWVSLKAAWKGLDVKWEHVRGHKTSEGNKAADKLARSSISRVIK